MLTTLGICSILAILQPITLAQKDCPKAAPDAIPTRPPSSESVLKVEMVKAVGRKKAVLWPGQKYVMAYNGGGLIGTQTFGGFEAFPEDDNQRAEAGSSVSAGDQVFSTMKDVIALMPSCKGWHMNDLQKRVLNCDYCWDEFTKIRASMLAKADTRFHNCKEIAKALNVHEKYCL